MFITQNGQMIDHEIKREFPIKIKRTENCEPGPVLKSHWHEEFMMFYIQEGQAVVHCNSRPIPAGPKDFIVINRNDIHYLENRCNRLIEYHLIIDFSFLLGRPEDICQIKYITPLMKNTIRFQNKITNDSELTQEFLALTREYQHQDTGYELSVKASLYRILTLLMRRYTIPADQESKRHYNPINQLRPVLQYIDQHYEEKLTLQNLANMAHMSRHHFGRLFKSITGLPPIEYINHLRINTAAQLLTEQQLTVGETALAVGFSDSNYFSRLFKKYKKQSPTCMQRIAK